MDSAVLRPSEYRFDFTHGARVRWSRAGEGDREAPGQETRHFVEDRWIAERFGHSLDAQLADWIDLALDAYVADRLAPRYERKVNGKSPLWSRILHLKVAVRQPEVWARPDIGQRLRSLLGFFTEDDWRIEFAPRYGARRPSETQGFLFSKRPPSPVRVALYSGGLDSFAGAAQQIADCPDHSFVFVSGATHPRQWARQRKQVTALMDSNNLHVWHVIVPYGLKWGRSLKKRHEEQSQRTRGSLYLTLGAATAVHVGARELFVYENGIGAINLPYNGTQIGTSNSRGVHPVALFRMAEFVRGLTGEDFQIQNPFVFRTKAEMCRHRALQSLAELVPLTFSCDGFPVRHKNKPQCGICTSCLLRRQSLESAGLAGFDREGYLNDLSSPVFEGTNKQLDSIRAVEWQAHRISRALQEADPLRALVREFVEIRRLETLCHSTDDLQHLRQNILSLYSKYVADWRSFSARNHCDDSKRAA